MPQEVLSVAECAFRAAKALADARIEFEDDYVVIEEPYEQGSGEDYAQGDVRISMPMLNSGDYEGENYESGDVWMVIQLHDAIGPEWLLFAVKGEEIVGPFPDMTWTTEQLPGAIELLEESLGLQVPSMPFDVV